MSVKRNAELLKFISQASTSSIAALSITPSLLKTLIEIAHNLLYNLQLELSSAELKQLRRHKEAVKQLANRRTSIKQAKRLLTPALIRTIVKPATRLLYGSEVRLGTNEYV